MGNERFAPRLWISFGIIVGSIAIAGVALYYFAGDLSANADAIVSARATVDQENSAVANLAGLKQQAVRAARYQAAMDKLVPDQYGLVTFTQWFSQQGKQYGISATAAFQGAVTPSRGSAPGSAVFSFSAAGPLDKIASFLDLVSARSPEFLISFDSYNITGDGGGSYNVAGNGTVFSR